MNNVRAVCERIIVDLIVLLGRHHNNSIRVHDTCLEDRVYVVDGALHPVHEWKTADCLQKVNGRPMRVTDY